MAGQFKIDPEYLDVAERIDQFSDKFPEGSLQSRWCIQQVGDKTFIVCDALAYRTPDDPRPGQGLAWEPFPGPTPFTRDSELMNAQTSAWGRAIVALGFKTKKIASRQEVQNRSAGGDDGIGDAPVEGRGGGGDQKPAAPATNNGAAVVDYATKSQKDQLNRLIGVLRPPGHITTQWLWDSFPKKKREVLEDGELHWRTLRDTLSKEEASALIDYLLKKEAEMLGSVPFA